MSTFNVSGITGELFVSLKLVKLSTFNVSGITGELFVSLRLVKLSRFDRGVIRLEVSYTVYYNYLL